MSKYNEAFIRNLSDEEFLVVAENNVSEASAEFNVILLTSAIQRIIKANVPKKKRDYVRTK